VWLVDRLVLVRESVSKQYHEQRMSTTTIRKLDLVHSQIIDYLIASFGSINRSGRHNQCPRAPEKNVPTPDIRVRPDGLAHSEN
jgi:hypothetical protein